MLVAPRAMAMDISLSRSLVPPPRCHRSLETHCAISSYRREGLHQIALPLSFGTCRSQSEQQIYSAPSRWKPSLLKYAWRQVRRLWQLPFAVASLPGDASSQPSTRQTRRSYNNRGRVGAGGFLMVFLSCILVKAIAAHYRRSDKSRLPPPPTVLICLARVSNAALWDDFRRNALPLVHRILQETACWKDVLQPMGAAAEQQKQLEADEGSAANLAEITRHRALASAFFVYGPMEAAHTPPDYSMLLVGRPFTGSILRDKASVLVVQESQVQADEATESLSSELHKEAASSHGLQSTQEENSYQDWLEGIKHVALRRGVREEVIGKAFEGVKPSPEILRLKQNQPEFKLTAREYLARMVNDYRVSTGVTSYIQNEQLLAQVSSKYGIPPSVLVAIWGIESSYGGFPGSWDVIEALVTLAFKGETDPRRASYFKDELIHALIIMNEGHGPRGGGRLLGSWAGAMGQCQFMPSSFQNYAVDYDEDGNKDIWESHEDIFASMANFLNQHGWKQGAPIAQKVNALKQIDKALIGLHVKKPVREWRSRYKIFKVKGEPDLLPDDMVSLIAPDGARGASYLVCDNFRTIMRYNPSSLYSLAILELSQWIGSRVRGSQNAGVTGLGA